MLPLMLVISALTYGTHFLLDKWYERKQQPPVDESPTTEATPLVESESVEA